MYNPSESNNRGMAVSEYPPALYSLSLKDHRFNRLNDCTVAILYHMDDIANYLDQFSNIINGMIILDRSFLEIKVLKPIYAAILLVGFIF